MKETRVPENRAYKVTLILLVGLAAFSTAMRDLNRLSQMVGSLQAVTIQLSGSEWVALNENANSAEESCPTDNGALSNSSVESGASDGIAVASDVEVGRANFEIAPEPDFGGKVELAASKRTNRSGLYLASAKYTAARNHKETISAIRRKGHWPAQFEYKAFDRIVTLDLPLTMVNDIKAGLETDGSPDFPLSLLGKLSRKQLPGKAENGKREFIIKRFERSTSSRRAS